MYNHYLNLHVGSLMRSKYRNHKQGIAFISRPKRQRGTYIPTEKHQKALEAVIVQLKCGTLVDANNHYTCEAIQNLSEDLINILNVLYASDFDEEDIRHFQVKFDQTIRGFDKHFYLAARDHDDLFAVFYYDIARPILMAAMGVILAVLMSPILPFSSSARDYVGSFFNPHPHVITDEFDKARDAIIQDAKDQCNAGFGF